MSNYQRVPCPAGLDPQLDAARTTTWPWSLLPRRRSLGPLWPQPNLWDLWDHIWDHTWGNYHELTIHLRYQRFWSILIYFMMLTWGFMTSHVVISRSKLMAWSPSGVVKRVEGVGKCPTSIFFLARSMPFCPWIYEITANVCSYKLEYINIAIYSWISYYIYILGIPINLQLWSDLIWLVVWNMNFIFPIILGNVIIPTVTHSYFSEGFGSTTNQSFWKSIDPQGSALRVQQRSVARWGDSLYHLVVAIYNVCT